MAANNEERDEALQKENNDGKRRKEVRWARTLPNIREITLYLGGARHPLDNPAEKNVAERVTSDLGCFSNAVMRNLQPEKRSRTKKTRGKKRERISNTLKYARGVSGRIFPTVCFFVKKTDRPARPARAPRGLSHNGTCLVVAKVVIWIRPSKFEAQSGPAGTVGRQACRPSVPGIPGSVVDGLPSHLREMHGKSDRDE